MTESRLVVDIRRHRGNSNYMIELVGRFSPGAAVEWLVRPDQAHLLSPESIIGQAESSDRSWSSRICEYLVQSVGGNGTQNHAASGGFWVLSYDNYLLAEVHKLSQQNIKVTTKHLSDLFKGGTSRFTPSSASKTALGSTGVTGNVSLEELAQLAKSVLLKGGHTSRETALPQNELRLRMSSLDARLKASTLGGITYELVDLGLQEGWMKRFRRIPFQSGTESLYLAMPPVSGAEVAQLAPPRYQHQPIGQSVSDGRATAETSSSTSLAERNEPDGPSARMTRHKHPNRATDFEAVLSKLRIGSLPETRDLMFDAVECVIGGLNGGSILLTELFARATTVAQQKACQDGFAGEKNWAVAERCIRRLMMWASVLIASDGQPVADKIGANASQVRGLVPDFRRSCEAFLAERIIAETGGIKYDDDPYYLGLTLYRRGKQKAISAEELKAKADSILVYLEDATRIELGSDRMIRTKAPKKVLALTNTKTSITASTPSEPHSQLN
jgi:hypothetical protein